MSKVEELKLAAAKLTPEEQFELFKWWTETDQFKRRQLETLRRDLAAGITQLDQGKYRSYTEETVAKLAEEIGSAGRKRMAKRKPSCIDLSGAG
jgi:hypothetical protein